MSKKKNEILEIPHIDNVFLGIAYACIAFALFAVMQASAKILSDTHNVIEISFYRSLISLVPMLIYIMATRQFKIFETKMPVTLSLRVLLGTFGLIVTFGAVKYLPMADATVLFFGSTILTPIIAIFLLNERIGIHRWSAVILGMVGVIMIAGPSGQISAIGVALALTAAVSHAFIHNLLRRLKSESHLTITFYFFLGGTIIPGMFLPFIASTYTPDEILLLLAVGTSGGIAQLFLTKAFQKAPASTIAPFNYTGLLWATGFDIVIWNYVPGWPVFAGGTIIILSKLYILHRESVREKAAQAELALRKKQP